jgi:hypothetical protein
MALGVSAIITGAGSALFFIAAYACGPIFKSVHIRGDPFYRVNSRGDNKTKEKPKSGDI